MNKPLNILVVDDDERLCNLLRRYLTGEGYHVATALNGEQMRRHIEKEIPDLVILDLVLPDADGLLLAQELRVHRQLGIIILTGKGDTVDRIVGLEVGADDYISKPFNNRELLARIHSVLRRLRIGTGNHTNLGMDNKHALFSGWNMDLAAHELVSPAGDNVYLTSKEFKLLLLFITSSRRVLSRALILDHIADSEWNPDDRRIDVLVGKLRKKIEADPEQPLLIKTIRGEGYMFTAQVDFK
jgi:DNA-binding response OmpR family regulator